MRTRCRRWQEGHQKRSHRSSIPQCSREPSIPTFWVDRPEVVQLLHLRQTLHLLSLAGKERNMVPATLHAGDVSSEELERATAFMASLPPGSPLAVMLQHVLSAVQRGVDVSYLGSDKELTPNQAAELLNVSRPHLLKVMGRGLLDYRMVGSNRRIAMADLMDYIDRHERGNAYINHLLDTREHSHHQVRDSAAEVTDADLAELDAFITD